MKKTKIVFFIFLIFSIIFHSTTIIASSKKLEPYSLILNPKNNLSQNVRGVALIYNIERQFGQQRTSLSVHALNLPEPSFFGDYNIYEVLAYIPEQISWTFRLHPVTVHKETIWVGKLDEISPLYKPTQIKVRLIDTSTNNIGPIVLENS